MKFKHCISFQTWIGFIWCMGLLSYNQLYKWKDAPPSGVNVKIYLKHRKLGILFITVKNGLASKLKNFHGKVSVLFQGYNSESSQYHNVNRARSVHFSFDFISKKISSPGELYFFQWAIYLRLKLNSDHELSVSLGRKFISKYLRKKLKKRSLVCFCHHAGTSCGKSYKELENHNIITSCKILSWKKNHSHTKSYD